jgi:hypothetical protein
MSWRRVYDFSEDHPCSSSKGPSIGIDGALSYEYPRTQAHPYPNSSIPSRASQEGRRTGFRGSTAATTPRPPSTGSLR